MALGPSYTVDLSKAPYNLRQKERGVVRDSGGTVRLTSDIELIGPQLGHTITFIQDRFPRTYAMLVSLGWTSAEMLGRTYFWFCFTEAHLSGINADWPSRTDALQRPRVLIPSGIWYYNTELRYSGQVEGALPWVNFGNGGTEFVTVESVAGEPTADWKSLYGPQQDGTIIDMVPYTYAGEGGLWPYEIGGTTYWRPYGWRGPGMGSLNENIRWLTADRSGGTSGIIIDPFAPLIGGEFQTTTLTCSPGAAPFTIYVRGWRVLDPGEQIWPDGSTSVYTIASSSYVSVPGTGGYTVWTVNENCAGETGVDRFVYRTGRQEWMHGTQIKNIRFHGGDGQWNDPSKRHAAILLSWPGETSLVEDCYFDWYNDFPILIDGGPAPVTIRNCSFFHNGVAMVGMRGGAVASVRIETPSGDFNPYVLYQFRAGEVAGSPNGVPFWPTAWGGNQTAPGGAVMMTAPKIESYCSRSASYGLAGVSGKGQMLARLCGRFHLTVLGGTIFGHNGYIPYAIRVDDDFFLPSYMGTGAAGSEGNIPLDNSSVRIIGMFPFNVWNWLHDASAGEAFPCHNSTPYPSTNSDFRPDFFWQKNFANPGSGTRVCKHPFTGADIAPRSATHVTSPQPFMEGGDPSVPPSAVPPGPYIWDLDNPPFFGYNPVTGNTYP